MVDASENYHRPLIERRLGSRLNDREWLRLKEEGRIPDGAMSEADLDALVALIRDRRATWGADIDSAGEHEKRVDEEEAVRIPEEDVRLRALAQILADHARQDQGVEAFRQSRLNGALIPDDRLYEWMQSQSQAEQPGILVPYVNVPIPVPLRTFLAAKAAVAQGKADQLFDVPVALTLRLTAADLSQAETRTLRFYLPKEKFSTEVQMKGEPGSLLGELSEISARLAGEYGWSQAEAVTFLLTDYTPPIVPARYKIEAGQTGIPALRRIVLTVDPAVAPQRVAEVYRSARQKTLPGGRVRDLSEKHRLLALFAARHPRDIAPDDLMAAWNEQYPSMRYQTRAFFVRDCRAALAHLRQEHEE